MKRIVITISAIVAVLSMSAQDRTTLLQRINEIKSQTETYFWDQYTHPDADTAKVNATKRLLLDLNSNRGNAAPLSVEDVMPHAHYINIDRATLKQCFVYIKKTDIINPPFIPDAFVQRVMDTKDFTNAYKLLKSLQAQGQILQFGKLKDVEDYSSLDLILFDMQSQQIITMLSPVTASGKRTNMVNGLEDSLDNYPTNMTAVIWYIKK